MAAPNYHLDHAQTGSSNYHKFGSTGEFFRADVIAAGSTGSYGTAGAAGVLIGNSAADAGTKLFTTGGDTVVGTDLIAKTFYPFAVSKVQATGGNVIVFIRQQ